MSSKATSAVDECRCTAPASTNEDAVADNLLNQNFNSVGLDKVWVGDTTYLKTGEGWMYLRSLWICTYGESWVGTSVNA